MTIITGKRVRKAAGHLRGIKQGTNVIFGVTPSQDEFPLLEEAGFSSQLRPGETILPSRHFGPVCRYNADGKEIVHKDQPKETAYRMTVWHWTEYHGSDEVEQEGITEVPYERYPRSIIPPPGIEISLATVSAGELVAVTEPLVVLKENDGGLAHAISVFLEIFGRCEVFSENLERFIQAPHKRLNWEVLPQGEYPWPKLKKTLEPMLDEAPGGNREVIETRLETINDYQPAFHATGRGGFRGYVIFGFPCRKLYVLECVLYGNATYVFGEEWEMLSQLTKAEILHGNLHEHRIIHRKNWPREIAKLLDD